MQWGTQDFLKEQEQGAGGGEGGEASRNFSYKWPEGCEMSTS